VHEERYQTGALLGRGGMAEVFAGIDSHLGRPVAIKRLRQDRALNPILRARFRREASAAARLNHPGIVAVLDTAEVMPSTTGSTPIPIIVMELVDGCSLRETLRDGPRPTSDRALEITEAVLRALTASHAAGIIHRDIKPANVLLTSTGQVKVADFGIARSVSDDSATQTQAQTVMGSPHYMSPEQARGMAVDHRSDLYSVGCLLYELLVGRPPFTGDSALSITYQHVIEPPAAPSTLDQRLSSDIDTLVMRALEKAPGDRYQSADQMRADLHRLRSGQPLATPATTKPPKPVESPPVRHDRTTAPRRTHRLAGGVLALALLVVMGLAGFGFLRSADPTTTEVPAVLGFSQAQAESLLHNARLVPRVEHVSGPSATGPTVTHQFPAAGRRAETNSTVTIRISTAPLTATAPEEVLTRDTPQDEEPEQAGSGEVSARKAAAATARPNAVDTTTSRTPRAPSSERAKTNSTAKVKQSAKAKASAKAPKVNKSGKAKTRSPKSGPQPDNRN
jgi:serine/threonine protein kinase